MKRILIVIFLLSIWLPEVRSQSAGIEITVRDISTYLPIEHVTVTWKSGGINRNTVTARTGKTMIDSLGGDQMITFKCTGYETLNLTLSQILSSGKTVGLNRMIFSFDEVVISAHRHEESKRDISQQIELIDSREIAKLNRQNTADLLQSTGEVMVQKSQAGGGSPVLRGFEANKILMVVDGIRMNNAIYRGGHLQNVLTIDQNMLERTEVIFGPGSVMYGSDALGGVVHFRTKNPAFAADSNAYLLANAMTRYSSANNEFTAHAGVETGGRKFASYTGITYSSFGDLTMGKNRKDKYKDFGKRDSLQSFIDNRDTTIANPHPDRQTESGYTQIDLIQKFSHKINDRMVQRLNIQFSTPIGDIPRYDRLTEKTSAGVFRFAEWDYGRQDRLLTSYEITESAPRKLFTDVTLIAAWQRVGESRITRRYGSGWRDSRIEELDIFSVNADFEKKAGGHETRYGIEWFLNEVRSTSHSDNIFTNETREIDTRYPAGGSEMSSVAAYLTHTWEITDKTIVNGGIRYTANHLTADFGDTAFYKLQTGTVEQSPSAFSGSAGLVYLPDATSKLSISLASGFRSPNVDDLAKVFESGNGTVIVPNPNLEPEYTYTAEAGFSKSFAEKIYLEGYGWYTWYRDAITLGEYTYNGNDTIIYDGEPSAVKANVNAGKAFLYGGTLILKANLSRQISLFSTLTYTYGRIETDSSDVPLDHIPPVFGRTGLDFQREKLTLSAWSEYHAQKDIDDYNPAGEDNPQYATADGMPAWVTFNISGSYAITKNILTQASVENLLDTHYRVFASGISAPGRNIMITLRANF